MFLCTNYVLVSSLFTSRVYFLFCKRFDMIENLWRSTQIPNIGRVYMFSWATYSNIVLWIILSILRKCLLSLKHTKDITMVLHFHLLNGILMLAVGTVGICGNCFCIVYFGQACTRRNKGQTYFLFMFCLAIFDLVAIICCILCFALPHYSYEVCKKSNYCRDMNPKNNR